MKMSEVSADLLEKKMRLAEKMLEKAGAVPLEINQKNRAARGCHGGRQIDARGSLADAALLIGNCYNPAHFTAPLTSF